MSIGDIGRDSGWERRGGASATDSADRPRLGRSQILETILAINPSATSAFLERFNDRALSNYLEHLLAARRPRGRDTRWERPGDSPAIMVRESSGL